MEEDFQVVKTRLGKCAQLQKQNPMVYKLRADFMQVRAGVRVCVRAHVCVCVCVCVICARVCAIGWGSE